MPGRVGEVRVPETEDRERVLIEQAGEGNAESFSQLVLIYEARAVHIAHSFLGNYEDARDVAQEAFIKCHQSLSHFRQQSRFYTWFYRILVNACKDFLRKKKVRGSLFSWLQPENEDEETNPTAHVREKRPDARASLMNEELGSQIFKALERLPLRQKSAFSLRYLEGFSLEEIAEVMDLSTGAVKANLWQAGQKMKNYLGEYLQEPH